MTADQKTGELLPCPFCGFSDWLSPISHMGLDSRATWIVCPACTMCGPPGATEDETVERWNRRAERNAGEGWVSVEERMPEAVGQPVLIYEGGQIHLVFVHTYVTGAVLFEDEDGAGDCYTPSHWRPLPPPPTTAARREG